MNSFFDGVEFVTHGNIEHSFRPDENRYFKGYYGLQYTPSGTLEYSINNSKIQKNSNHPLLITRPNIKYFYGAPEGESRHHTFLCFKGERVDKWIETGLFPQEDLIEIIEYERFYTTITSILDLLSSPKNDIVKMRAINLLEGLLIQIHEQKNFNYSNIFSIQKIKDLAQKIREFPINEMDWSYEAKKMNCSLPHFRRLFKEVTGYSPQHYFIECKLQYAIMLLLRYELSISEVSDKCGFSDAFYFSKLFKKYKKISPKEYRNTILQKM